MDRLYDIYHKKENAAGDPVCALYRYGDNEDIEIAGLVASVIAYGRAVQIRKSMEAIEAIWGKNPKDYLNERTPAMIKRDFQGFKHRWTTGAHIAALLQAIQALKEEHASLAGLFAEGIKAHEEDYSLAAARFAGALRLAGKGELDGIFPDPSKQSAMKRVHLYLRWMVRKDEIDPGAFSEVARPAKLVIPLDTHLFRFGCRMGWIETKSANLKSALCLTNAFRALRPHDPVRYDFTMVRLGIEAPETLATFIERHKRK